MVILYFVRWFNIILVLRFLFQPGRLCTKLGFFVYYYLPYCYLHQTQENENVRTIKEGKIILKIALRIWSYVLDFLLSNPIVWSYIFRRIYIIGAISIHTCGTTTHHYEYTSTQNNWKPVPGNHYTVMWQYLYIVIVSLFL